MIADTARRRLVLGSDLLGSYPLYWTLTARGLVFASELSAVLRHPAVRRELDAEAVADYIALGMPFGTHTLASGVHLLAPGSLLTYDWQSGRLDIQRISDIATAFEPWQGSQSDYVGALCHAFAAAVRRSLSGGHQVGLSLSGGLDSRAILSAAERTGPCDCHLHAWREGCADEVIARQLAEIAGTRPHFLRARRRATCAISSRTWRAWSRSPTACT